MVDSSNRYQYTSLAAKGDEKLRSSLLLRSDALNATRHVFRHRGYVEIDTPILKRQEDPTDNPLFTTLGPLGWPRLHLRTCPEEYTRRAAALLGKAYEIGKSFRNETIGANDRTRRHLVEFTLVEFYEEGNDLNDALNLLWKIIFDVTKKLNMNQIIFGEHTVAITESYDRVTVFDALESVGNTECDNFVQRHKSGPASSNREAEARTLGELLDRYVRPNIGKPCYISDFPRSADPYPDPCEDGLLQRAELTIAGLEIGEVAVLQNDWRQLEGHLQKAISDRHGNYHTSQLLDRAYLDEIRELNTPVIGGGIGFDRLMMLLAGQTDVREVVWYPEINQYFERERSNHDPGETA